MTNKYWNKKINNNFNNAARCYSKYSLVQKYFANKLLIIIKELEPQIGKWIDLGAGTGYLADLLEKDFILKEYASNEFINLLNNSQINQPKLVQVENQGHLIDNNCIVKILKDWL